MSKQKIIINTDLAPQPVGAYNQAVVVNGLVFVSGQIAIDPVSQALCIDDFETESHLVLSNLKAVLEAAGSSMEDVIKVNIFLTDMTQFGQFNTIYSTYFTSQYPARALVEVSNLPKGVHVEVEAVAQVSC